MSVTQKHVCNSHIYGFFHNSLSVAQLHILTLQPQSLCKKSIQIFKDEPRTRVSLIQWHGKKYILKYYNVKSPFFRVRRLLFPSLARQKWQIVQGVKNHNIATPELLASVDVGKKLHYKGTLCLYEYVKPDREIITLKKDFGESPRRKMIIDAVVSFVKNMHQSGICHGDAKISNFLWQKKAGKFTLQVIDLDGVCFVDKLSDRQRLSELATLITSLAWWKNYDTLISQCFQLYLVDNSSWCRNYEAFLHKLQEKVKQKLKKRKKTWKP